MGFFPRVSIRVLKLFMLGSVATLETRLGRYSIVQAQTPAQGLVNVGVLLEDPESDCLLLRFRRDLESIVDDEEDREVLEGLAEDLAAKAREMGAGKLFEYLESSLSGAIRVMDREEILVEDFARALDRLYRKNVQSKVLEFRTHLPRYSLRAAAGKFLENDEISEDGWIETPEDLRLTSDMFVAEIAGHSMEPLIPDGSLCVFRRGVVGSRQGRLVLVENRAAGGNERYTVKRYKSKREQSGDEWRHSPHYAGVAQSCISESLEADPDEDKYRDPGRVCARIWIRPLRRELAHHVRQNSAVAIVFGFLRRVDAHDGFEGFLAPSRRDARLGAADANRVAGCLRWNIPRSR